MIQLFAPLEGSTIIDAFLAKHYNGILQVTIEKPPKKRSMTANNYLWILCDRIASALQTDKETIYKALIRRVGVFTYVLVKEQAADRFAQEWNAKGIGWFCENVLYKERGIRQFRCFYGSSVYTQEELSRVITEAEEEAKATGVETMRRKDVEELLSRWQ